MAGAPLLLIPHPQNSPVNKRETTLQLVQVISITQYPMFLTFKKKGMNCVKSAANWQSCLNIGIDLIKQNQFIIAICGWIGLTSLKFGSRTVLYRNLDQYITTVPWRVDK